jgi:hypothetical protein
VIQYRRLTALLLGAWLGGSILTDVAVTQNFSTVDRFLKAPGNAVTSEKLNVIGRPTERLILRRNAAEESNWIFLNWERLEFVLGGGFFLLLLFGDRPQIMMLALSLVMLAIVVVQHFLLTPEITDLGRVIDDLQNTDPEYGRFWTLHGFYSALDILKMLVGFGLAVRLIVRRKADKEVFAREYAANLREGVTKVG